MKSHSPFFGWVKMLPSNRPHNLEQECSLPPIGPLGLLHTHIFIFSLCVWNSTARKSHAFLVTGLSLTHSFHRLRQHCLIQSTLPTLRHQVTGWSLQPWGSVPYSIFSFYAASPLKTPPSIHWSSISPWPWTIILLHCWALSRMFISILLFNGIVNDLRGVNHSQDNGCKKLIDMIFMI